MSVKLVAFDVDGVLTDGRIFYGPEGESLKVFHAHDGYGIKLLQQAGFIVAVISGRESAPLRKRLSDLGVEHVELACKDKVAALRSFCATYSWSLADAAFMGDDLIDYPVMEQVGYRMAPSNAIREIKDISHFITEKSGGTGAVREAVEHLLSLRGISALSLLGAVDQKQ